MRAAALLVILAILTTLAAGAQCVAACAQPAPPPCHHAPQKAAKSCDTSVIFDERHSAPHVETPAALARITSQPELAAPHLAPRRLPLVRPPARSAPLILRI